MALPNIFATQTTGNHPASLLDQNFQAVGVNTVMPCTASGTNTITLTPLAGVPTITAYQNYMQFSFFQVVTTTGVITLQVGSLPGLNCYPTDGPGQLGVGALHANAFYTATYSSALNSGTGGFVINSSTSTAFAVTPEQYGAAGTAASDTAGIQAAINSGAAVIQFAPRVYLLAAAGLTGTSNQQWLGAGRGQTIIRMSIAPTVDMIFFNAQSNIQFVGITFDGNGVLTRMAATPGYPFLQPCLSLSGCTRISVRYCEFIGFFSIAMLTNISNNIEFRANYVTRATPSNGSAMTAGNFGISFTGTGTIDANNLYNFVIDGNWFTNCQISISGHDGSITNNTVTGWGFSAGINTQSQASNFAVYIGGNTCHDSNQAADSPGGYFLGGIENWASGSTIEGNKCYGNWGSGIDNGGKNCAIVGNTCFNNGNGTAVGGITMYYQDATFNASGSVVSGNRCYDTQTPKKQAYGYFENSALSAGTGIIVDSSNNFNGNLTGTVSLQATARASNMAAVVTLDSASGFTGGIHQNLSSLSMGYSGFQMFFQATGTAYTGNHNFSINLGDASRNLTLGGDITTAGALTVSGAFGTTLTVTGTTSVTFPTSGTLLSNAANSVALGNLAQIAAFSLLGNTTAGTANIGAFTIGSLTQKASPTGADLIVIQDQAASGALKFSTLTAAIGAAAVVGPGTSTNKAAARFNGAGGNTLQDSGFVIADTTGEPTFTGAAWTTFSPTVVSGGGGAFTTASGALRYRTQGKTITLAGTITITTVGTGSFPNFTLPVASSQAAAGIAQNTADGTMWTPASTGASTMTLRRYDNAGAVVSGTTFVLSLTYEIA